MVVEKIPPPENQPRKEISDDEWIEINLKLICENNRGKILFKDKRGNRANKASKTKLGELLKRKDLAVVDDMKSYLLDTGEIICNKFNSSWLEYSKSQIKIEQKEQIIKNIENQNKLFVLVKNYKWLIGFIILIVLLLISIL